MKQLIKMSNVLLSASGQVLQLHSGQVLLVLLLVMVASLAIGLSIIQRSLTDLSTSTKVEQSSRAFSAAEAGIEKALSSNIPIPPGLPVQNNAQIKNVTKDNVPALRQILEYPALSKEEPAHVWLADPNTGNPYYLINTPIDIYWGLGTNSADKPAIALTLVYYDGVVYKSKKCFLDSGSISDPTRVSNNNFVDIWNISTPTTPDQRCGFVIQSNSCSQSGIRPSGGTTLGSSTPFLCKTTLSSIPAQPMILRARMLYNYTAQPFAVGPTGLASLPPQGKLITSTGVSGETERRVQVLQIEKVVPFIFDYAIFSAAEISK